MQFLAPVAAILTIFLFTPQAIAGGFSSTLVQENDPRELRLAAFQKYLEGDFPGASALYERAIAAATAAYGKNSSFVADLCYEVGTISLEDGQFQTAEKYLKLAVQHKPNSVMARVKYADLLAMRGNQEDAFGQIQEAMKANPGSPVAQQAMVKWMMGQANHRTADGAIANVAATWEAFRLRTLGKNSVQATMADITNWKNGFMKPVKPIAKVAAAAPPKEPPKPIAKPKEVARVVPPPPPVKANPKISKVKPVERSVTAIKPREPEKPRVEIAKPAPEKQQRPVVATESAHTSKKSKNGLVPPPPPGPVFGSAGFGVVPPPPSNFTTPVLSTTAEVKKEKPKKKPKPVVEERDEDPDYLLDWGAVDGKKKSKD